MERSLQAGWSGTSPTSPTAGRRLVALALRAIARSLARASRRVAANRHAVQRRTPELEFYRESGAPEGALYADGHYVGRLPGVTRL